MKTLTVLSPFTTTVTAIAALALSSAASALTITTLQLDEPVGNPAIYTEVSVVNATGSDVGSQFQSNWLLEGNTFGGTVDLSATALWTITEFTENSFGLSVDIVNTTVAPADDPDFNAAILSFGFATNPDTNATLQVAGSTFDTVGEGSGKKQNFPGGFKGIDVCLYSHGCSGGSINTGLNIGEADHLEFLLSPDNGYFDLATGLDMSIFAIKFQGTQGSYEFMSAPNNTTIVPLPGAAVLFGIGIAGFGVFRRIVS